MCRLSDSLHMLFGELFFLRSVRILLNLESKFVTQGIEYPAGVAWDETYCTIQYSTAAGRRDQRSTILLWTQSTDSEHWLNNWASPRRVLVRPSMDRMRSKILLWEIPEMIQDCSDPNRACWLVSKQDLNIVTVKCNRTQKYEAAACCTKFRHTDST